MICRLAKDKKLIPPPLGTEAEFLFTHFSEFGGPNMDIFGGKSEDFGSPLNKIYSLFGGNSEDFGCPVDRHGT